MKTNFIEKLKELISFAEEESKVDLAEELEFDVARIGRFKDMKGKIVEVTKTVLEGLAKSLDLAQYRPKVTLGHVTPKSEDPSWGDVTGLRVEGDKLFAKVAPTPAMLQKMKDREYTERSIEYAMDEKGNPRFLGLAMLGARAPAIKGLSHLALSSGIVPSSIILLASEEFEVDEEGKTASEKDDKKLPLDTSSNNESEDRKAESEEKSKEKAMSDETKEALARAEEESTRLKGRIRKMVEGDVKRFMESESVLKRVGVKGKANAGRLLTELASMEANGEGVIKLAAPDGTETESSLFELAKSVLLGAAPQLAPAEETETVTDGDEEDTAELPKSLFAQDDEGKKVYLEAQEEIGRAHGKGEKIDFAQAVQRITQKRGQA